MKRLSPIFAALFVSLLQAEALILSSSDIGDNYDDAAPADLLREKTWLGLFITGTESREGRESRLRVARVAFVPRREAGRTIYRIVTTPPGPELLLSGVPRVSAGAAVTVGRFIDLWEDQREAEFRLGERLYRIRLESKRSDLCDAVITLTSGSRTQKLLDATEPGATKNANLVLACDGPRFRVHWAGDLDRDGRLDLLVTFSHKYSYFPNQLLLSSAARSQDLVAEVGRYERFSR